MFKKIIIFVLLSFFASSPVWANTDPLDWIFRGVTLGMAVEDVETRIKKYSPPVIYREAGAVNLQWRGEDLLKEEIGEFEPGPISNLTIKFRDGRVICAFYNFYYGKYSQHLHRGVCPYP